MRISKPCSKLVMLSPQPVPFGYDRRVETRTGDQPTTSIKDIEDDGFGFETQPAEPVQQVSSLIAIIRIIAVLGMGLCISFGLFISLVGVSGMVIGIPLLLLSIPMFFAMQYAEKWAQRHSEPPSET